MEHEKRKRWKDPEKQTCKSSERRKKIVPSSTEESYIDISPSWTDEEIEEFERESNQFNIADFDVVKFTTKKDLFYFVGQITHQLEIDEYKVTFLQWCE